MPEKYWMNPAYLKTLHGLDQPALDDATETRLYAQQPRLFSNDPVPNEWFWFDADDEHLFLNVHQSYFDITNEGRSGGQFFYPPKWPAPDKLSSEQEPLDLGGSDFTESYFVPSSRLNDPEWASFILHWADVFQTIGESNFAQVDAVAQKAQHELDSIVHAVSLLRFTVPTRTPQLIDTFTSSLTQGGTLSAAAKEYIATAARHLKHEAESDDTVFYDFSGTEVLQALHTRLFADTHPLNCGVGLGSEGRFVSNTGLDWGTGSLMVLPEEISSYDKSRQGYIYSEHNLGSATLQLWAFAGLARVIGDAHRHYDSQFS